MAKGIASKMNKGIFWFICFPEEDGTLSFTGEMISLPVPCDLDGHPAASISFNSQKGDSNTHKNSWKDLVAKRKDLRRFSWNYFPRGRVEILRGRALIYMNPQIQNCEDFLERIQRTYGIGHLDIQVKIDNSVHYQCAVLDDN